MKNTLFRTNRILLASKMVLSVTVFSGTTMAMEHLSEESYKIQDDLDPVIKAKTHLQVGERLLIGEGVPQDYVTARKNFEIAAGSG